MSVSMQIVNVYGLASYTVLPQIVLPFEPKAITVFNEDTRDGDDAFISFDGKNDMGHIVAGASIDFTQRVRKVWLRSGVVGASPTNIQVIAES